MTLTELYDISESENVPVYSFQMNECESISVLQDGNCFVAIDPMKLQSETEEKEKLSHELGHCATGAFYNRYAACDICERHERRANIWSIKKLIPKDELLKALDACRTFRRVGRFYANGIGLSFKINNGTVKLK